MENITNTIQAQKIDIKDIIPKVYFEDFLFCHPEELGMPYTDLPIDLECESGEYGPLTPNKIIPLNEVIFWEIKGYTNNTEITLEPETGLKYNKENHTIIEIDTGKVVAVLYSERSGIYVYFSSKGEVRLNLQF